jgi:hypothetical protein
MRPPIFSPPILRLSVRPDEPAAVVGPRPRGSRRPHTDATLAAVRNLVEQTTLTYGEIAARTGVGRASICRWTRDGGWQRPAFAPRATDTVPSARAGARLKARMLATRLAALAERYIRELEASASVDADKLGEALELLKIAKLAARPRKRRPRGKAAAAPPVTPDTPQRPIVELCVGDVSLRHAPRSAVEDFLASRAPPGEEPAPRRRSRRSKSAEHHGWMLERDSDR